VRPVHFWELSKLLWSQESGWWWWWWRGWWWWRSERQFTDSSLGHCRSPSFAVSVDIPQLLIYVYSSPSPIPFCLWTVNDSPNPVHIYFHRGKVNVHMPFQQPLIFMTSKNSGQLASRNEFREATGYRPLKSIKSELSRENQDECDSYVREKIAFYRVNDMCITSVGKMHSIWMLKYVTPIVTAVL